jgi:hypothetical protein
MMNLQKKQSNAGPVLPFGLAQQMRRRKTVVTNTSGMRMSDMEDSKGGTFKNSLTMQRKMSLTPGTPNMSRKSVSIRHGNTHKAQNNLKNLLEDQLHNESGGAE